MLLFEDMLFSFMKFRKVINRERGLLVWEIVDDDIIKMLLFICILRNILVNFMGVKRSKFCLVRIKVDQLVNKGMLVLINVDDNMVCKDI